MLTLQSRFLTLNSDRKVRVVVALAAAALCLCGAYASGRAHALGSLIVFMGGVTATLLTVRRLLQGAATP